MTEHLNSFETDVVVVGAGLTGLSTAYKLIKGGKKVVVIEKNSVPGGVIQSVENSGFIYEKGPTTGVINNTCLVELLNELKESENLEVILPDDNSKNRWILKNNQWNSLPSSLGTAVKTPLFSFYDKFRILGEPFRRKGVDSFESIASMVKRRLGKSFLDYAVDPFISGVYAGDPETLITRFALPKLYFLEQDYGSFVKGSIAKAKMPKTELEKQVSRSVFSVKGGLSNLIQALVNQVDEKNILTDCNIQNCAVVKGGFLLSAVQKSSAGNERNIEIKTNRIVSTVDPVSLDKIFPFIDLEILKNITNIRYASVIQAVVNVAQWRGCELNAFGGLIPTKENKKALGILFPSSLFPERAPENGVSLSVFLGGMKHPEMIQFADSEIKDIVCGIIEETMNTSINQENIQLFRYSRAIPQYEASSEERFKAIEEIQNKYPGLILAGNMRDGIGMGDRVKQAYALASQILEDK